MLAESATGTVAIDISLIVNVILTVVMAALSYILSRLNDDMKAIRAEVAGHVAERDRRLAEIENEHMSLSERVHGCQKLHGEEAARATLRQEDLQKIDAQITRIFEKLDENSKRQAGIETILQEMVRYWHKQMDDGMPKRS